MTFKGGVKLPDDLDDIPCYQWGEADVSDTLVEISAFQAWSCWAYLKILESTHPKAVPRLAGVIRPRP